MALASLLMGAGATRPGWFAVGASFIVVDTLVHNFLVRTGILDRVAATHPYGPACYRPGGCADVLIEISTAIRCPPVQSRVSQGVSPVHSAARFGGTAPNRVLDICNGNQIDDRGRCTNMWCRLYSRCDRLVLHQPAKSS